jgi:hypothetical protein
VIQVVHLREPELEFGGGMRHLDIRFGLMDYGPFDSTHDGAPRRIRIGIVGGHDTVEGTASWLDRCRGGLPAQRSRQPNLFPQFPGTGDDGPLRCEFIAPGELQRFLSPRDILRLVAIVDQGTAAREIVSALVAEIRVLVERNTPPDVILCALPLKIIEKSVNAPENEDEDVEEDRDDAGDVNLRGLLKSACMELRIPIQLLWPTTYDPSIRIPRKLKQQSERRVQDDATRAWNFFTALYYKASGLPWRLARDPTQLKASYVGISFYRSPEGDRVHTSTAQMFDERGEGLILRGGRAVESKEDRRPHLLAEDAYNLLANSLTVYRAQHGHFPARVVLHKTSTFDAAELDGFNRAMAEHSIEFADFIFISKSFTRLYRLGAYPPLRGTMVRLDERQATLYTKGSVEFFRTYPGMYVPRPVLLRCQEIGQPLSFLAQEVLALSKMNWNNTQFDGGYPITIRAARHVADILKYVPDGHFVAPRYSFYM